MNESENIEAIPLRRLKNVINLNLFFELSKFPFMHKNFRVKCDYLYKWAFNKPYYELRKALINS